MGWSFKMVQIVENLVTFYLMACQIRFSLQLLLHQLTFSLIWHIYYHKYKYRMKLLWSICSITFIGHPELNRCYRLLWQDDNGYLRYWSWCHTAWGWDSWDMIGGWHVVWRVRLSNWSAVIQSAWNVLIK